MGFVNRTPVDIKNICYEGARPLDIKNICLWMGFVNRTPVDIKNICYEGAEETARHKNISLFLTFMNGVRRPYPRRHKK
jgi:hypothetical protein